MSGVVEGFATIGLVIALGAALAHAGFLGVTEQHLLSRLAFFVGSPALLLDTISHAPTHDVISRNLLASAASAVAVAAVYVLGARLVWHRSPGDTAIGALSSGYVNAGNLGLPIAAYVLGSVSYAAPTLLLQLLVLQPAALAVLDADRTGRRPSARRLLRSPLTNPLTLGALAGLALSLTGTTLPTVLANPISMVAGLAVPAMLIAYGVALRLGPGLGGEVPRAELATTTVLKAFGQPAIAYAVARLIGVSGHALLAIVVMAALPTAQNIFIHANRYGRATTLARDTILLTTMLSVPVILAIAFLLR
ncbi:MAG: AEC family transporter [Nostocoides sp.]